MKKMVKAAVKEKISTKKTRDPEGTRRRIMDSAIKDFSRLGFGGARVDKIATSAKTNERMLYYYYGSKQGLFLAVLEEVFLRYNEAEKELHLDDTTPIESMRILASFMWDYYYHHPEFIRLLNSENLHEAKHIKQSDALGNFILPFIKAIDRVLLSGAKLGVFRKDVDSVRFYLTISALGYYILSNRFTLSAVTGKELMSKTEYDIMKNMHLDVLISYLVSDIHTELVINTKDVTEKTTKAVKNIATKVATTKIAKTTTVKATTKVLEEPKKVSTSANKSAVKSAIKNTKSNVKVKAIAKQNTKKDTIKPTLKKETKKVVTTAISSPSTSSKKEVADKAKISAKEVAVVVSDKKKDAKKVPIAIKDKSKTTSKNSVTSKNKPIIAAATTNNTKPKPKPKKTTKTDVALPKLNTKVKPKVVKKK